MDMLAARSFRVLLTVSLAANCCLPCYTLAYADDLTDGGANYEQFREDQQERAGDGQADQGPDFQGVLRYEAPEEASPGSELSHAAGIGRICPSGHVLVEASYSLADTLIRFSSVRAYADESQEVENVPQEEQEEIAGGSAGGLEFSPGVGESISYAADGGAAGEGYGPDYGASEEAGGDSSASDGGLDDSGNFSERVLGFLEDITYLLGEIADYYRSGLVPGAGDGVVALAGFGGGFGSNSGGFGGAFSGGNLGKVANNTDIADLISSQWGWNYGKTAVLYSTSPAGWLRSTSENTYNAAGRISGLLDRGNVTNDRLTEIRNALGYGYAGTRVIYNESPAAWLQATAGRLSGLLDRGNVTNERLLSIVNNTGDAAGRISGLLDRGNVTNDHLSNISTYTHDTAGRISGLLDRGNVTNGYLSSVSGVLDTVTKGPEGGRVSFYSIGNAVEVIKNETRDLDNLLESIDGRVSALDALGVRLANIALTTDEIKKGVNSSLQWYETLHGDLSMLRHGAADLLPGYADWTVWDFLQGIYFDMGNVVDLLKGLQQTLTAWGDRWDSQDLYLMEWAKRWDALDKSPVDLSETNKLLGRLTADVASIRDKYVLDDALSTILDVLVGDLQTPQTQAALSSIQDVMATRFPFCIPSLVNVVLFGSVLADAAPPVWEFDIAGSPLVVDFSDYGQFAEVCRWTVLVLFTASLLLNTRRFIFGMGGGVE